MVRTTKAARKAFGKRAPVYARLKKDGMSRSSAAAIANAGRTKAGRSRMARKAARSRAN